MWDLEFSDSFWRAALTALAPDTGIDALAVRYPGYVQLLADLAEDAARESRIVGLRLGVAGRNPRLFGFLTAAFLARSGRRSVYLDLSPDVRWLEHLLGIDLKEGVVDHLQYGIPLESVVRPSGVPGLEVATGGAYFLTGSPLEDAPGLRGSLDSLRASHDVVVVALPPPLETTDEAGVPGLCDALVTVEDGDTRAPLAGSERALVRLAGDPQAAGDLARMAHRFTGPLPRLVAMGRAVAAPVSRDAAAESEESDLAALAALESGAPLRSITRRRREGATSEGGSSRPGAARRRARWVVAVAALAAVAVVAVARGQRWLDPLWGDASGGDAEGTPVDLFADGGSSIPLNVEPSDAPASDPTADSTLAASRDSTAGEPADSTAAPGSPAVANPGRPAPYSIHVASYQSDASVRRLLDRLASAGWTAYRAPVDLDEKGSWDRIFVGAYPDVGAARADVDRLLATGLVDEAVVRPTPYAFRLGVYPDAPRARSAADSFRQRGVPVYALGQSPVRLYAGAYRTEDEAGVLARSLSAMASAASLTRREE